MYHKPDPSCDQRVGVLILMAAPQETMRFHWTYRQLGMRLAGSGYHSWRFDYRGTGDSPGDEQIWSLQNWLADTNLCLKTIQQDIGVRHISLVGLRLGGLLAGEIAKSVPLKKLVLIDPVTSGEEYLESLARMHHLELTDNPDAAPFAEANSDPNQCLGFAMNERFRTELKQAQLDLGSCQSRHIHVIHSACWTAAKISTPDVISHQSHDDLGWNQGPKLRLQAFPQQTIQLVQDIMEDGL